MLSCWLLCTIMGLVWMYIVMGLAWIYAVMGLVWIYGAKNTVIMEGRDSVAENHYNDSPIVITIQYISQNFLSSLCIEISQKLTDCIVM
jgi:hypothetical protein